MDSWLKYIAYTLIGLLLGGFMFDVVKHARAKGGQWKDILLRILIWIFVAAIIIAVNCWINKNWVPGKFLIRITPF